MTVSCKLVYIIMLSSHLSYFNLAIIIGYTNTNYTVNEGIGTLQVEIQVFSPADERPLPASVDLVIHSVSGSASKCTESVYLKTTVLILYIRIH